MSFSDIDVSNRALCTVATILALLRIIVWSFIKRSTSRSVIVATASRSKSAKALDGGAHRQVELKGLEPLTPTLQV